MDMKKILQALDTASTQPVESSNDMKKFLRVVSEGAPVAQTQQSPEQIAYNQLRAQLDSADSLRGGANTYTDVSPEVAASTNAMRQKLAQMAAALKLKGIDAEAEYNAPDASVPAAAPVDLNKYNDQDAAPVAEDVGMSRLLSIVTEGKDSGNRLTQAEQLTMQTYAKPQKVINPDTAKKGLFKEFYERYEKALNEELEEQEEYTVADIAEMVRQGMSNEDIANELGFNLNEGKIKGADGKACWKGKRYGGTKNGKDICLPVKGSK